MVIQPWPSELDTQSLSQDMAVSLKAAARKQSCSRAFSSSPRPLLRSTGRHILSSPCPQGGLRLASRSWRFEGNTIIPAEKSGN